MLIAQRPTLSEESVDEFRSRFVIEPLEPGFGYTLGNSLRRTLLSSIPGASVTSIKVDTVLHEFSTIEGVKEDVTEVILNLKGLVVSSEHDEPVTMYLRKSGPGDVTAADIAPPAGVEVHNPDLKIATLSDKGKLEMELVVERGRGYVSAVQNKGADNEIGRMPGRLDLQPRAEGDLQGRGHRVSSSAPTSTSWSSTSRPSRRSVPATRSPRPARPSSSCSAWRASSTSRPRASTSARRRSTSSWPPTWPCRSRTCS